MNLHAWAMKWGIPPQCLRDLHMTLGTYTPPLPKDAPEVGKSEGWVDSVVALEASQKGIALWRNNVGALTDKSNRVVRFGLMNESKAVNEKVKSGDRIGIRPVLIQQHHVGHIFGQFLSREMKKPGWQFDPNDEHEAAQLAWANLVNSMGGDARFATGVGTL